MRPHQPSLLAVPVEPSDHVLGARGAPVTLVEYGDFECPGCKQAAPAVELLLERFPEEVLFVYRHYPLEEVHPHALAAAEAAESAGAQGKFWPMHKLLFDHQSHLRLVDLLSYTASLGVDMPRSMAEMADHVYLQRVRGHISGARRSGVHTTPAFFVNGTMQDVSIRLSSLFEVAQAVLEARDQ